MTPKLLFLVGLVLLAGCATLPAQPLQQIVSRPPEPRQLIAQQQEWKEFCDDGIMVRDPGASVSRRCQLIEYPNKTEEWVNCIYYDDLTVHYRCVNATVVLP